MARRRKGAVTIAAEASEAPQMPQVPVELKRVEAPVYSASTIQTTHAGNDVFLTFIRPHPATLPDGNMAPVALGEAVAIIHVSMATLKDLSVLLRDVVAKIEEKEGTIETDFTRKRAKEKAAPKPVKH